jgi:hypothetical protein
MSGWETWRGCWVTTRLISTTTSTLAHKHPMLGPITGDLKTRTPKGISSVRQSIPCCRPDNRQSTSLAHKQRHSNDPPPNTSLTSPRPKSLSHSHQKLTPTPRPPRSTFLLHRHPQSGRPPSRPPRVRIRVGVRQSRPDRHPTAPSLGPSSFL